MVSLKRSFALFVFLIFFNIFFIEHPLAEDFDILLGNYSVQVPTVTAGEYQILGKK